MKIALTRLVLSLVAVCAFAVAAAPQVTTGSLASAKFRTRKQAKASPARA